MAKEPTVTTKSLDAARPLGASGYSKRVQHGNAPSPGDTKTTNWWKNIAMLELGWILESAIHFERLFK